MDRWNLCFPGSVDSCLSLTDYIWFGMDAMRMQVVMARRDSGDKRGVKWTELIQVAEELKRMQSDMLECARAAKKSATKQARALTCSLLFFFFPLVLY